MFSPKLTITIEIPALDRLLDRYEELCQVQQKIDALCKRVSAINAAHKAALKQEQKL